jgi:hypothetical protein
MDHKTDNFVSHRWDVTLSFLARTPLRLPLAYLEMLVDNSDGLDFFALNGCSIELVVAMARLAKLASIKEQVLTMEWTIFDMTPVDKLFVELKSVLNTEDVDLDDIRHSEDGPGSRRDKFHCLEAWRHAVLLYICRVFKREQDTGDMRVIDHLTRVILDHVRCISRNTFVQKQVLLPIFLAGSEVGGETDREFVREYCRHWSRASHFDMFESTRLLLEDVWSQWQASTRRTYWWGLKVGVHQAPATDGDLHGRANEVLLG